MESEHRKKSSGNGFFSGFVIGVILGGGAVFLLGTKKVKKILESLKEEASEGIEEVEDMLEEAQDLSSPSGDIQEDLASEHKHDPLDRVSDAASELSKAATGAVKIGKRFFKRSKNLN